MRSRANITVLQSPLLPSRVIVFDEPRLTMSWPLRFAIRTMGYVAYFFLGATAFVFLISDLHTLRGIGMLLVLFFLDRLFHLNEADEPLEELPPQGTVNSARYLSPRAYTFLERAFDASYLSRKNFFLILLKRLLQSRTVREALARLDVKPEEFEQKIDEFLESNEDPPGSLEDLSRGASNLMALALISGFSLNHQCIGPEDLFIAVRAIDIPSLHRLFDMFSVEKGDLERAVILAKESSRHTPSFFASFFSRPRRPLPHRIMNRAWTSRPTPTLDAMSVDMTDLARGGSFGALVGHGGEFQRLLATLARSLNPNALLVGDVGAGKEAIVGHFALALSRDEVPEALFDKRLVKLELGGLVADAPPEELQRRLTAITQEIMIAGNIILYIPDIHYLVKTSGAAYLSVADALLPILKDNRFPVVGATYPREFQEYVEPRSDFVGLFEVIRVQEIKEEEAEQVLAYRGAVFEAETGVAISFGAIKTAVRLAKKYLHEKLLPASAEELLKAAIVEAQKREERVMHPDLVTAVAENRVEVPIHEASAEEKEALLHLEDRIHETFVGQDEAVRAIAQALREYRSGLARAGGPIATFLFVGPTGVGKTELAKVLARVQFGSERLMLRFDMTEYNDTEALHRFIGSPDGKTGGALTEAVLHKPYSLLLFDEFEKASPDILNLFLQVFDDGRLTDTFGRTVDFQNTIIIATSNAHSDIVLEALQKGESMESIAEYMKKRLTDVFKPELLNRFSRIVVFRDLTPPDLQKIVALQLEELKGVLEEKGIHINFSPEVFTAVARLGYDPSFGARPLRRVLEEKIRAPLASFLLEHEVKKGGSIFVDAKEDGFQFSAGPATVPP